MIGPAQKRFGHPMQDLLPAHSRSFAPEWQHSDEDTAEKATDMTQAAKRYYDRTAHTLPIIQQGSQVVLQNPVTKLWDTYGIVVSVEPHHKYHVRTNSGKVLVRNRRFVCRRRAVSNPLQAMPSPVKTSSLLPPTLSPPLNPPTPELLSRRSGWVTRRPRRLVEDPTWNRLKTFQYMHVVNPA